MPITKLPKRFPKFRFNLYEGVDPDSVTEAEKVQLEFNEIYRRMGILRLPSDQQYAQLSEGLEKAIKGEGEEIGAPQKTTTTTAGLGSSSRMQKTFERVQWLEWLEVKNAMMVAWALDKLGPHELTKATDMVLDMAKKGAGHLMDRDIMFIYQINAEYIERIQQWTEEEIHDEKEKKLWKEKWQRIQMNRIREIIKLAKGMAKEKDPRWQKFMDELFEFKEAIVPILNEFGKNIKEALVEKSKEFVDLVDKVAEQNPEDKEFQKWVEEDRFSEEKFRKAAMRNVAASRISPEIQERFAEERGEEVGRFNREFSSTTEGDAKREAFEDLLYDIFDKYPDKYPDSEHDKIIDIVRNQIFDSANGDEDMALGIAKKLSKLPVGERSALELAVESYTGANQVLTKIVDMAVANILAQMPKAENAPAEVSIADIRERLQKAVKEAGEMKGISGGYREEIEMLVDVVRAKIIEGNKSYGLSLSEIPEFREEFVEEPGPAPRTGPG